MSPPKQKTTHQGGFLFWCNISGENLCERTPFLANGHKGVLLRSRVSARAGSEIAAIGVSQYDGVEPSRQSFCLPLAANVSSPDGGYHSSKLVSSVPPSPIFRFVPKRNIAVEYKYSPHSATHLKFLVATSSVTASPHHLPLRGKAICSLPLSHMFFLWLSFWQLFTISQ